MRSIICAITIVFLLTICFSAYSQAPGSKKQVKIIDEYHYSESFTDNRSYRIFLPPDYEKHNSKKYPVIYFFHGWAQRYFGSVGLAYSAYDRGEDNDGDNFEKFRIGK